MKILIINGPNLNLLGKRSSEHYGEKTMSEINSLIQRSFSDDQIDFFQSNIEGELVDKVQSAEKYDGLIINPGGFAHTSIALRDSLELFTKHKIEVHLSNLASRENFRKTMITASVCDGYICGFKEDSYIAAILILKRISK